MIAATILCLVIGVSDGDTLIARCGEFGSYKQVKIRLAAIDAPETRQPFGQRSKQSLSDLCFQVEARITYRSIDRYGRTIADVECRAMDAGQFQIASGMAWFYVKYGRGYERFRDIESTARSSKLGLWRDAEPIAPWDWRTRSRELR